MKRSISVLVIVFFAVSCRNPETEWVDFASLVRSIDFEIPVDLDLSCMISPENSTPFVAKLMFQNAPPLRSSEPGFPSDYCSQNAVLYGSVKGEGVEANLGKFSYSERFCGFPGTRIVADVVFSFRDGDELHAKALAQAGPTIPPPFPNATFTGTFIFTGGTGKFGKASGKASLEGQQIGEDPLPNMPANIPGKTAVVLCGWIDL